MRDNNRFNALQENQIALSPELDFRRYKGIKGRMCWRCQKDKPMAGGDVWTFGGGQRFICKECAEERRAAKAAGAVNG